MNRGRATRRAGMSALSLFVLLVEPLAREGAWAQGAMDPQEGKADAPVTLRQAGVDAHYVFGRPFRLDRSGRAKLAWSLVVGASLYTVRRSVRDAAQRNRTADLDRVLQDVREATLSGVPAAALGFYLAGTARDSAFDHETAMLILESLTFSYALGEAGRWAVASERPNRGESIHVFAGGGHSVSGDVSAASSLIAPIADRHLKVRAGDSRGERFFKRLGTIGLYGAAGLVAYQRIDDDRHWLPDVYLGYLDGLCVGRMLVDSHRGGRGWGDGEAVAAAKSHRAELTLAPGGVAIRWGASP